MLWERHHSQMPMNFSWDRHQLDPTKKLLIILTSLFKGHFRYGTKHTRRSQPKSRLLALGAAPGLRLRAAYSPFPPLLPVPFAASSALTQGPFPLHLLPPRAEGLFSSPTALSQKQGAENPARARSHFQRTPWIFLSRPSLLQLPMMDTNVSNRAIFENQSLYNKQSRLRFH